MLIEIHQIDLRKEASLDDELMPGSRSEPAITMDKVSTT